MPSGSIYTFTGVTNPSNNTTQIETSQGFVALGTYGYFLPAEVQAAAADGLILQAGIVGTAAAATAHAGPAITGSDGTVGGPGGSPLTSSVALVGSPNVFTAEQTAPDLKVSGLTGATAASRYVGATASGAPASGTFAKGDFVIDQAGTVWICTVAGTPGTWLSPQQGIELGYAQITSNPASITGTSFAAITGLTTTVTVGARPILIRVYAYQIIDNNATVSIPVFGIFEDGTQIQEADVALPASFQFGGYPLSMVARSNPAAASHTYAVQAKVGAGQSAALLAKSTAPAFIQVVQL